MLEDLNSQESQMLIEACGLISDIRISFSKLTSMNDDQLHSQYGTYRVKLGQLALIAEKLLRSNQRKRADIAIQLLHKPLTGEV